ncbi:hypothetical protein A3A50_02465 [Candidatus Woesebacteria bacterium RIFCSPLOWO2_01_FULL_38_20]|nr:MAG: hypothetical protein A3A50_02465 [Candidatus Woesebacteria bacterium RIFCSPLOWO2_01_FULL_38_20]
MKSYRFSVIVANYNGEKYIENCLSSLFKTEYKNFEVVLIDDGSNDSSLDIINKFIRNRNLVLIKKAKNQGLVTARNIGIEKSSGDILVFLDNDTQVDRNWLIALSSTFLDKSVGACQCKIFDYYKRDEIQEVGMKIIPYFGWGMTLGRGERDNNQFNKQLEIVALGAAVAVRKEVVNLIDGFDQKLNHYTDDIDFSWRIWLSGFRIVLSPYSYVYHYTKIHNLSWKLYFHLSKNSFRMVIKNYELKNVIKYLPVSFLINCLGTFFVLVKRFSLSCFTGVFLGLCWTVINLNDTLRERKIVQKFRKFNDKTIFKKIMAKDSLWKIYRSLDYSQ